jgi:hypothetical protein
MKKEIKDAERKDDQLPDEIVPVCSFTSSGSAILLGPSTAIRGRGPRTIATSSQAYSRGHVWQSL